MHDPKCISSSIPHHRSFVLETIPLDCLFHIYQYLAPVDVANVSEASVALCHFARENNIFKKFADFGGIFSCGVWKLAEFECVVRYFGEYFNQITLDSDRIIGDPAYNLALVLHKCPNLKELRMINVKLRKQDLKVVQRERCFVRRLFVKASSKDIHLRNLLTMWPQITTLSIHCTGTNQQQHPMQITGGVQALESLSLANATINCDHLVLFLQKHVQSLRNLSLINIKWTSTSFFKALSMFPHLQQLQISITCFYGAMHFSTMNYLKYLQLVSSPKAIIVFPLSGLEHLEELDLVQINGEHCCVAVGIPNLRLLSIHDSAINEYCGLIDIIDSLPNLQCLHLRRSTFWPDDLVYVIQYCGLDQIVLELVPIDVTIHLIQLLAELDNDASSIIADDNSNFELQIIVDKTDVSIAHLLPPDV